MVLDGLGGVADFSYWQCYEGPAIGSPDGPIAQLDRVTDFYSVGCRFESCWDRHKKLKHGNDLLQGRRCNAALGNLRSRGDGVMDLDEIGYSLHEIQANDDPSC
jgi:hypothetical protein